MRFEMSREAVERFIDQSIVGDARRPSQEKRKPTLARVGRSPFEIRSAARALERRAFRDIYVGQGLQGARDALKAARDEEKVRRAIREQEQVIALELVADL